MYVIKFKNVNKKFRLYHEKTHSLKERILRRSRNIYEELWALKNINFEVKKGETIGIIGKNGSGKSTLLKLIAKIFYTTTGEIIVNGKISSESNKMNDFIDDYNNSCSVAVRLSPAGYLFNAMTFPTEDNFTSLNIAEGADNGPWFEPYRIATIFCLVEFFRSFKNNACK